MIYINHPNGFTSVYAHLNKFGDGIQEYVKSIQYEKKSYETGNIYLKENQIYDFVDCYWSIEENFQRFYAGYNIGRFGTENTPDLFQNPDGIQGKNDLEIIEDILYHYTKSL